MDSVADGSVTDILACHVWHTLKGLFRRHHANRQTVAAGIELLHELHDGLGGLSLDELLVVCVHVDAVLVPMTHDVEPVAVGLHGIIGLLEHQLLDLSIQQIYILL